MHKHVETLGLVELDTNDDASLVWMFPAMTPALQKVFVERCALDTAAPPAFSFSRFESSWQYIYTTADGPSRVLPRVKKFSLCSCSQVFNPEKQLQLLKLLARIYSDTGEPTKVLEGMLHANTTARFELTKAKGDTWVAAEYQDKHAKLANCSLKQVVATFGMSSIQIWLAVLLKKRVVVYAERWSEVFPIVRALPQFAWVRGDWSILRPMVMLSSELQRKELEASGVYIAGVIDPSIHGRADLYDVLIDASKQRVVISDDAKTALAPAAVHASLAQKMVELADHPKASNNDLIKAIVMKTNEYLGGLQKLGGGQKLTMQMLQAKNFPQRLKNFLFNLALAEGKA